MEVTAETIAVYESVKQSQIANWQETLSGTVWYSDADLLKLSPSVVATIYPSAEEIIGIAGNLEELSAEAEYKWIRAIANLIEDTKNGPLYTLSVLDKVAGEERIYINGWDRLDCGGKIWIERQQVARWHDSDWRLCHTGVAMGAISTQFGRKPWEEVLHQALASRGCGSGTTFDEIRAMCGGPR